MESPWKSGVIYSLEPDQSKPELNLLSDIAAGRRCTVSRLDYGETTGLTGLADTQYP